MTISKSTTPKRTLPDIPETRTLTENETLTNRITDGPSFESPLSSSQPSSNLPKLEHLSLGKGAASPSATTTTHHYPSSMIWPPPSPLGLRKPVLHGLLQTNVSDGISSSSAGTGGMEQTTKSINLNVVQPLEFKQPGVHYNGTTRVFTLQCKQSTYVFRVDDAKNLEHLYWGPSIPRHDDVTYLTSTNVPGPFDPKGIENVASRLGLDELSSVDDEQDAVYQWRQFKNLTFHKKKGRLENASWRLWRMKLNRGEMNDTDDDGGSGAGSNIGDGNGISTASNTGGVSVDLVKKALGKKGVVDDDNRDDGIMERGIPEVSSVGSDLSQRGNNVTERKNLMISKSKGTMTYNLSVPALSALDEQQGGSKSLKPPGSPTLNRTTTFSSFSANSLVDLQETTNWGQLDPEELGKNTKLLEWSDRGTGDYREPSFQVRYKDGSTLSPLAYRRHKIYKGKPHLPDPFMPHIYLDSPSEATTLEISMCDALTNLTVKLFYTVMHDYDVIIRRHMVCNETEDTVTLSNLMSCTLDFDAEYSFHMTQLCGGWARERQVVTRSLDEGLTVVKSNRGASSHQFNPFIIITPHEPPEEDHGEAFSFQLIYSGNFIASAEVSETRRLRVNMGINPEEFSWALHPGASFSSPECILSYSENGIGPLSRGLHRLFRERLIPRQWRRRGNRPLARPILLNTWECNYFQVSHESLMDIAECAKQAGVEMIVLDDGWFGERNDTNSSLGDWFPDLSKLPFGISGLVKSINNVGMRFGIWVEPEMVSKNSKLYNQHPEWCLSVPNRPMTKGRNQLVLDFSRESVRDYIFNVLNDLLCSANIEYVKWDMNRHLTEVFSQDFPAERQGEIGHRYILGVYEVLYRLMRSHRQVLIETCSGGGGRYDAGMLFFGPQIWASDNTDAVSRVSIQYGTSLAYPPCTMGSHVSAVPNHQTLRTSTLKTRSLVAYCGTFGYELDPRKLSEKAMEEIRDHIQIQKWIAPLVYDGDIYRLWNPFKSDSGAWMFVSQDQRQAVVTAVNIRRDTGRLLPRLRLRGLNDNIIYEIEELAPGTVVRDVHTSAILTESMQVYQFSGKPKMSGKTLSRAGLPVKFLYDSDSVLFVLHDITGKRVQDNTIPVEPTLV